MCSNSGKSSDTYEKLRSSLRHIRKKNIKEEKKFNNRERENYIKRIVVTAVKNQKT